MKEENGPNLKSALDEKDSKFSSFFDKILLKNSTIRNCGFICRKIGMIKNSLLQVISDQP